MWLPSTLCYIEDDGQYLMLHRNKKEKDIHEGYWTGVGGKSLAGESPHDCVKREVLEETGLVLANPKLRGVLTFPGFSDTQDWLVFLYTATEFSGELISECPEGELAWVPIANLDDLSIRKGDKVFLSWLKEYAFFTARFDYQGQKMLSYQLQEAVKA